MRDGILYDAISLVRISLTSGRLWKCIASEMSCASGAAPMTYHPRGTDVGGPALTQRCVYHRGPKFPPASLLQVWSLQSNMDIILRDCEACFGVCFGAHGGLFVCICLRWEQSPVESMLGCRRRARRDIRAGQRC